MDEKFSVGAVVVTFNRKELLRESIDALLKINYDKLTIFVIDNNSTDGTQDFISDLIDGDKVVYKNTGVNLGGAGGFNFGIKMAVQQGCDYVWIMDDDCVVHSDSLQKLIDFAGSVNNDFGFLSSKVLWKDGSPCRMNIQKISLTKKLSDFSKNQQIKFATFVSMLLKREVVEDVGLPIKDFFIWGDDWEYSTRISKKYKNYFVADSEVTHKCAKNLGADIVSDDGERLDRYKYQFRNENYLYRKNVSGGVPYFWLKIFYKCFKIVFSKSKMKLKKLGIVLKNSFAGIKFNPKIEYAFGPKTNVIDTQKFTFNGETRKKYREELKLGECFTLLNVGRFAEMKNHKFMVNVAKILRDKGVDFKFIFVGDGELKDEIVAKINELNLSDCFVLLEKRSDVAEIMMASDVFVLPSLFEGLPVVAVESQTTGLATLCSNLITTEVGISDKCEFLNLDENLWVERIIQLQNIETSREKYAENSRNCGYDAKNSAEILEKKYLGE